MMKMNDIGETNQHYKAISALSISITLALLQAYLMLIFSGLDLFNFSMLQSDALRYIVQVVLQLIIFAGLYAAVYFIVKTVYCRKWIKENKHIWVQGTWLHIHSKNNIRVGTVEIEQNFNTISAQGHNICPKGGQAPGQKRKITTWYYTMAQVMDDKLARDFLGCYTAQEMETMTSKDGIHMLKILPPKGDEAANQMLGSFRDTFRVSERELLDIGDHAGQLYFFRLSPEMEKYLCDPKGFRYDLLEDVHEKPEFANEPYVIQLKECLEAFQAGKTENQTA